MADLPMASRNCERLEKGTNNVAMETPKTFTCFPKLPLELKRMIWGAMIPQAPQIIPFPPPSRYVKAQHALETHAPANPLHHPPVVASICHESRKVAFEHGAFYHGCKKHHTKGIWLNPKTDKLWIKGPGSSQMKCDGCVAYPRSVEEFQDSIPRQNHAKTIPEFIEKNPTQVILRSTSFDIKLFDLGLFPGMALLKENRQGPLPIQMNMEAIPMHLTKQQVQDSGLFDINKNEKFVIVNILDMDKIGEFSRWYRCSRLPPPFGSESLFREAWFAAGIADGEFVLGDHAVDEWLLETVRQGYLKTCQRKLSRKRDMVSRSGSLPTGWPLDLTMNFVFYLCQSCPPAAHGAAADGSRPRCL